MMRAPVFALLLLGAAAPRQDVPDLIQKLGSQDFEEQGKAAKALEALGPRVLPALRGAAENGTGDVRTWAQRLIARLQENENRARALVARLAAADGAAEAEIRKMGWPAADYLREALGSEDKELARRAQKLLEELEGARAAEGALARNRHSGKRDLLAKGGGDADSENAVLGALKWLSRHQSADGSWKTRGYKERCRKLARHADTPPCTPNPGEDEHDAGVTALALLAFLGAGYTPLSPDDHDGIVFGETVKKGLQWFLSRQRPDGDFASPNQPKAIYVHALAAQAMAETYGFTGLGIYKDSAQKAVTYLLAAQNPGKGWRYGPKSGDNDSSVTGVCVGALHSAELARLHVPRAAYDGARAWLDEVTEEGYSRVGYTHKGTGKVFIPGKNEDFDHHETLTALGVTSRLIIDRNRKDPKLIGGCDLLLRDKPSFKGNETDFYYWLHASQAIYQLDGPSGKKWQAWNLEMKRTLTAAQNKAAAGCTGGSWEPVDRWSLEGGRVYATAINALTLETYYRYAPLPAEK